jgi:hypothetical protein
MRIISHRGNSEDFNGKENTIEAFLFQLNRGLDIEFDVRVCKNNKVVIHHDSCLSNGEEISSLEDTDLPSLEEVLSLIIKYPKNNFFLHFKYDLQENHIDTVFSLLKPLNNLYIFDLTVESASYICQKYPGFMLGCSISPKKDINDFSEGTLISWRQAILFKKLYNLAWLDQWRENNNGFYPLILILLLKVVGYKVALVAPDLHSIDFHYRGCLADFICTDLVKRYEQ